MSLCLDSGQQRRRRGAAATMPTTPTCASDSSGHLSHGRLSRNGAGAARGGLPGGPDLPALRKLIVPERVRAQLGRIGVRRTMRRRSSRGAFPALRPARPPRSAMNEGGSRRLIPGAAAASRSRSAGRTSRSPAATYGPATPADEWSRSDRDSRSDTGPSRVSRSSRAHFANAGAPRKRRRSPWRATVARLSLPSRETVNRWLTAAGPRHGADGTAASFSGAGSGLPEAALPRRRLAHFSFGSHQPAPLPDRPKNTIDGWSGRGSGPGPRSLFKGKMR
jgi:hypothetical protein